MKRALILPVLVLFLLCGCAAQQPQAEPTAFTSPTPLPTEPVPDSDIAVSTWQDGDLQCHDLGQTLQGILSWGDDLLLFSGDDATVLSILDTDTMTLTAAYEPGFLLLPEHVTVQRLDAGLSYFDSSTRQTVILDQHLQPVRQIPAPEGLTGFPLLSADGHTLCYCTADAIRVLDLDSGISRILKEAAYPVQGLSGLLLGDTVVQVSITDTDGSWWTLFLSADNGQLIRQCSGNVLPETSETDFFLTNQTILFGNAQGKLHTLTLPVPSLATFFLPDSNQALSITPSGEDTQLSLYDLKTGRRQAEFSLSGSRIPEAVAETQDGHLWFLCPEDRALYRWDPAESPVSDDACYAGNYFTRSEPDYEGLAACSLLAQTLSEQYGIQILVYKDAAAVEPWDYQLEEEYRADVLLRELNALDARLSRFPEGFLKALADKFTSLTISLVGHAEGSPASGSLEAVNGLQFLVDFDAYIVLATDHDTQYALYHELSHLMETVVLTQSVAYDRWNLLNPQDFQYDNEYTANQNRDGSPWLKPGCEFFIDTYAMSYPWEDRARLFEYAMTPGHEDLFVSPNLQAKLRQMCMGIREAFRLENATDPLPWEQYLAEPLM